MLLDVPAWGEYRLLGQTLDDAAGEAFDKVATLLGLGYPGGPALERLAARGTTRAAIVFPARCSASSDGDGPSRYAFSFSGLKTAVLRAVPASTISTRDRADLARGFQDAALDVLVGEDCARRRRTRATRYGDDRRAGSPATGRWPSACGIGWRGARA